MNVLNNLLNAIGKFKRVITWIPCLISKNNLICAVPPSSIHVDICIPSFFHPTFYKHIHCIIKILGCEISVKIIPRRPTFVMCLCECMCMCKCLLCFVNSFQSYYKRTHRWCTSSSIVQGNWFFNHVKKSKHTHQLPNKFAHFMLEVFA